MASRDARATNRATRSEEERGKRATRSEGESGKRALSVRAVAGKVARVARVFRGFVLRFAAAADSRAAGDGMYTFYSVVIYPCARGPSHCAARGNISMENTWNMAAQQFPTVRTDRNEFSPVMKRFFRFCLVIQTRRDQLTVVVKRLPRSVLLRN